MIDPRTPDYANTPVCARRPVHAYAPAFPPDNRPAPAATIITPFFNTGEVFHETAACVMRQSLQNFEWLIIDDGTADPQALAILDQYRACDPRVRVVSHDVNRGLSAARNTGFREAATEFVFALDSDDLIEPTTLEKCLWYLQTHPEAAFVKGYSVGFGAQEYLWTKGFHCGADFLRENMVTATTMIRRGVWHGVGGFDESIRGGLEDWDFWLRCASQRAWGATIPEYLDWYRRRAPVALSGGPWENLSSEDRLAEFRERLAGAYPGLFTEPFPTAHPQWQMPYESIRNDVPVFNPLACPAGTGDARAKRMLLIAPWLTMGGADKFNLAMVRELARRGWLITIATTVQGDHSWLPEFTTVTPDVFAMPHFLRAADFPVFLRYLVGSRAPDVVMVSNSELGYHLTPYLRAHFPEPTFVDLSHMEETGWKNGGHPRYAVGCQGVLDLNISVSDHLKGWMVERGAEADRVEVCYVSTCEDEACLTRDELVREQVRTEHGLEDDHLVLLYAGRLVQQKQPRVFAETMRLLDDSGADFTCFVAGDGPDMGWLRQFVSENRLSDRVRLLGALPQDRVRDYLSASDIFFLPSQWEGIALSIYEAMAMELAVVGADVGGQRELVTEDCGILLARSNEEDEARRYADQLRELLSQPRRVRAMGNRARERVLDGFTPERMGARLEEIFERAARLRDEQPRARVSPEFGHELACRGVEYIRAFSLAETLWNERENLWRERDSLRTIASRADRLNGHPSIQVDTAAEVKRIVQSNLRYRAVDRVNDVLKSVGVHRAIKTITVRAFGVGKRR